MTTPALTIPLTGRALIEASAGTGKTWTLTGIILRLLIEGDYEPRGIIATTFTRKAAAEMQQRVQKRLHALRENLKAIASGYFHDETLLADDAGLAARLDAITTASGGDDINRHLIANAVKKRGLNGLIALFARVESLQEHLDEIFIGTIDSLCQRWLAEFALETGNDERLQINENSPALEETVHDALRRLRHAEYLADPDAFARRIAQGALHDSDAYLAAAREATTYRDAKIDSDNPKTDSDDTPATYDSARHATLVQQLRSIDPETIASWQELTRSPAFLAAVNNKNSWHKNLDALPELIHQLQNEQLLDDTTTKLAPGFPNPNYKKGHDALATAYSTHPLTILLRDLLAARDAQQQHHAHRTLQTTKQLLDTVRDEYPAALVAHLLTANSPWARRNPDGSLARIRPGDIQILTRGNDSLAELQTKLHARHIDSELNHDRSVFGGTVARTFADLLAAIEQPDQRDRQNRLLGGHYYGYSQTELDRLAAIEQGSIAARADELTLADLRDALARAQDDWQNHGLLAALNPLLTHRKHNIWQTLASHPAPDNLRHLLDPRHIQTIIAEHAPGQRPAQFAAWWRDQLAAPPDADWAKAPPLPGDDAVRLLTIHKAKGLESPITILATGGVRRGGDNRARIKTWRYRDGGRIRITLDKPAGDIETRINTQENDENRRLLYVGLTRAKNLLLVAHREKHGIESTEKLYQTYAQNPGQCPHADEIPISVTNSPAELPPPPQRSAAGEGWGGGSANIPGTAAETTTALPPPADLPPSPCGRVPTQNAAAFCVGPGGEEGGGVRLHTANAETTTVLPPPPQRSAAGLEQLARSARKGWGGGSANIPGTATEITTPPKTWRTRFHGWQRSSFSALLRDAIEPTSPDLADYAIAEHQTAPDAPADADIRYTYPRGTAPGSALHAILEHTRPDHRDDWRRHLDHENQQWQLGLEPAQLDACETWLDAIYHSTLPQSGITLGDSKRGNHRSEYNFTLGSDDRAPLPVARINRLLTAAGYPLNLHQHHRHIRYIRGEIDHIYQHDGRYYILDYKTNHLGNHPDDYTPAKIREAMNDHHYWLQAALYQVALHRLLKTRLPDYDPARHLGGIEYHYLRGIDPARPAHGTYGWNYPPDFIAELDHILGNNPA